MAGGGQGSEPVEGPAVFGFAGAVPFLPGPGVTCSMTGRGRRGGSQAYLGPRALCAPGDMMIDCCDVRSHVVSESVKGGWLMPGT